MKKSTKSLLSLFISIMMIMIIGLVTYADTSDQYFTFTINTSGGTFTKGGGITPRTKSTDTKVYVYMTQAPYVYVQVKTWGKRQTARTYYNETIGGVATVQRGVQCSITNNIFENAGYKPTLSYITIRSAGSGGTASGRWSPDSSRNYVIVN